MRFNAPNKYESTEGGWFSPMLI